MKYQYANIVSTTTFLFVNLQITISSKGKLIVVVVWNKVNFIGHVFVTSLLEDGNHVHKCAKIILYAKALLYTLVIWPSLTADPLSSINVNSQQKTGL